MCKSFNTSRAGFTLIELMMVIAIAGIMILLAAPSFVSMTQRYRALSEVNGFAGDLLFARSEAIKRGAPVSMCVSSDGATCLASSVDWHKGWIIFTDAVPDLTIGTMLRVQKGWTGTDTFKANNSLSSISYSRDGFTVGLPSAGGLVVLTLHTSPSSTNSTQCVTIVKTGRHETLPGKSTGVCT